MTPQCGECKFGELAVAEDGPVVECRRYPPVVIVVEEVVARLWPQVSKNDWCGEYRKRIEVRNV